MASRRSPRARHGASPTPRAVCAPVGARRAGARATVALAALASLWPTHAIANVAVRKPMNPEATEGAQDASLEVKERARALYLEGTRMFGAGEYQRALEAFLDSQQLHASPAHHYNIAKCQEALGKLELAISYYEAYLRSEPDDANSVRNKIADLNERLRLEAELADVRRQREKDDTQRELDAARAEARANQHPGRPLVAAGVALLSAGVATAAVGGSVFGMRAKKLSDEVAGLTTSPGSLTFDEATQRDADGQTAQRNLWIVAGVGAAVAVTGAALVAVGVRANKRAASSSARLTVTPVFGPQGSGSFAGLAAAGRF